MKFRMGTLLLLGLLIASNLTVAPVFAEDQKKEGEEEKEDIYQFTHDIEIPNTPVKNQSRTGTCWAFATISFLESEILRMKDEEVDLSEIYIARQAYPDKATNYVRLHGNTVFGQGGQAHDVLDQIRQHGLVPESVYDGLNYGSKKHNHGELVTVLKGMLDGVIARRGKKLTPRWPEAIEAVLDVYLGEAPESFEYNGKTFTPREFADDYLAINPDDYIELTSYSIYPFYKTCRLEIPDNWTQNDDYYNIPIDDLEKLVDHALEKGYSVAWDGDVSERDFAHRDSKNDFSTGYAILPLKPFDEMTIAEKNEDITEPVEEKVVSQEDRDETFLNYLTTDDHLMHLVGLAHDQNGTKFYIIKNSWGTDRKYKGYYYMSQSFFRMKMVNILINKAAIPRSLAKKINL